MVSLTVEVGKVVNADQGRNYSPHIYTGSDDKRTSQSRSAMDKISSPSSQRCELAWRIRGDRESQMEVKKRLDRSTNRIRTKQASDVDPRDVSKKVFRDSIRRQFNFEEFEVQLNALSYSQNDTEVFIMPADDDTSK